MQSVGVLEHRGPRRAGHGLDLRVKGRERCVVHRRDLGEQPLELCGAVGLGVGLAQLPLDEVDAMAPPHEIMRAVARGEIGQEYEQRAEPEIVHVAMVGLQARDQPAVPGERPERVHRIDRRHAAEIRLHQREHVLAVGKLDQVRCGDDVGQAVGGLGPARLALVERALDIVAFGRDMRGKARACREMPVDVVELLALEHLAEGCEPARPQKLQLSVVGVELRAGQLGCRARGGSRKRLAEIRPEGIGQGVLQPVERERQPFDLQGRQGLGLVMGVRRGI